MKNALLFYFLLNIKRGASQTLRLCIWGMGLQLSGPGTVVKYLSVCRYFTFLVQCQNPKACTIMLRGASKDILNEVERNLQDAMNVARNVMVDARLVPGGGAVEMALAHVSSLNILVFIFAQLIYHSSCTH